MTESRRNQAGLLPPDWLDKYAAAVEANVFGEGSRRDAKGNPVEQGRGSADNQTSQSVEAYRKWGKDEPDYERTLARMEKQLAASEIRRKALADFAGRKGLFQR